MDKVIREGMVAVLVSRGFGAGWSSWAHNSADARRSLFDPAIVAWVEGGKVEPIEEVMVGYDEFFYTGGSSDLRIEWVSAGSAFRIDECDGSESLIIGTDDYHVA